MTRYFWTVVVTGLLLGMNVAHAGEADELRERAGDLKRKAAELMQRGEKETAQRLIEEAKQLGDRAQMLDREEKMQRGKAMPEAERRERELQHLHARLKDLHAASHELWASDAPEEELLDIRHHIQKVEAMIADRMGHRRPHAEPGAGGRQETLHHLEGQLHRIEHLRNASEHLQAADMPDLAQALREKSMQMEHAVKERLEQLEKEATLMPSAPQPTAKSVEDALRQEVKALRNEIEKLRQQRQP